MAYDLTECNATLLKFSKLVEEQTFNPWKGKLKVGVDLGTANIVLAVTDEENNPVAGASDPSTVVRDGIVVDYAGAVFAVRRLKKQLEELLGTKLDRAATAIPPGIIEGNIKAISNVVESADFTVTNVIDEPTAAATVLGVKSGAVVDVGGGTTGVSILKNGKVIFTGDEPTGGTHMTLVLAGFHKMDIERAEEYKKIRKAEDDVFPVIKPVIEKMATIIKNYIKDYDVDAIYVVGGACCFTRFEEIFQQVTGIPTYKPAAPLLVTPLGIAMNSKV